MKNTNNVELADVIRQFGPSYIQAQGERILPSQLKALSDIEKCRTKALGGTMYHCSECHNDFWVYHSCRNRFCPACHGRETRLWLQKREAQLLGCDYYHIIVTVPNEIRAAFLADQKRLYSLFMKTVADSVIDLAKDKRFIGGTPAILMVLHTWSNDIQYHPHLHMLVSAGGINENGDHWMCPQNARWLIPVKAISKLVRNRFRKKLECISLKLCDSLPQRIWKNGWNAFCKHFGKGEKAVLEYLGRYVFRIAITNARIVGMNETHVTFRSKNRKTGTWRNMKLRGEEFLRRFVMHVLPKGFHKVRYYGLWHHSKKELQTKTRLLLEPVPTPEKVNDLLVSLEFDGENQHASFKPQCPHCGCMKVLIVAHIDRTRRR